MKTILLAATAFVGLGITLNAAESSPKDDVLAAAKKLGGKDNYSWKTTVAVPESAPFKPGPTEGKTEKDGFTSLTLSFAENDVQAVLKGDKGAAKTSDSGWQTLAEMANEEGPMRFTAMRLQTFKAPAAQVEQLVGFTKEVKKDGDVYSADLTDEGAKTLLSFRRGGGDAPSVSNASGSVKFWVKDGVLSKYEFSLKAKMSFNGNEFDADRTSTVVIKDVGTTKVTVPDEAKKKLS